MNYRLISQGVILVILVFAIYKSFTLPAIEPLDMGTADQITGALVEDKEEPTIPEAPVVDVKEPNDPSPPCNVCSNFKDNEVQVYVTEKGVCSDRDCSCISSRCDLDWSLNELRIHMSYENKGQVTQNGLRLQGNCKSGIHTMELAGGLRQIGEHTGIVFPKNRAYISKITPGGYFDFSYILDLYGYFDDESLRLLICDFEITDEDDLHLLSKHLELEMQV